jgi:hypothetical protein
MKSSEIECKAQYRVKILNRLVVLVNSGAEADIDEIIGDHQCGFRRNSSTTDNIIYILHTVEKKWEHN